MSDLAIAPAFWRFQNDDLGTMRMGRMKRSLAGWPLSLAILLAACGQGSGNEYLGKWTRESTSREADFMDGERTDVIKDTLVIERNGDGFMLRTARVYTQGDAKPTVYPEVKEPAVLKDGQLQVSGGLGAFVIDKASGHLISPDRDGDYTRVK